MLRGVVDFVAHGFAISMPCDPATQNLAVLDAPWSQRDEIRMDLHVFEALELLLLRNYHLLCLIAFQLCLKLRPYHKRHKLSLLPSMLSFLSRSFAWRTST